MKKNGSTSEKKKNVKRVVAMADLHCGHLAGLTPPEWWFAESGGTPRRNEWAQVQRELWREYEKLVNANKEPDVLIVNGDMIDGIGDRSGSTEQLTTDLYEQAAMAATAIRLWEAKKIIMSYGTRYHVSPDGQDMEKFIARECRGEVHSHPFVTVEGVTFDIKHHVQGGMLPHTRPNVVGREWLWNVMWALKNEQPLASVYLRAHLHFFCAVMDSERLAIVQPALQAAQTKYGARYCRGTVDWGIVTFEVADGRILRWAPCLVSLMANKTEAIVV